MNSILQHFWKLLDIYPVFSERLKAFLGRCRLLCASPAVALRCILSLRSLTYLELDLFRTTLAREMNDSCWQGGRRALLGTFFMGVDTLRYPAASDFVCTREVHPWLSWPLLHELCQWCFLEIWSDCYRRNSQGAFTLRCPNTEVQSIAMVDRFDNTISEGDLHPFPIIDSKLNRTNI
jgi:hypothetical protein